MHNCLGARGDKVLRGRVCAAVVIGADVGVKTGLATVYRHQGGLGMRDVHERIRMGAGDDAVHLIGEEHIEIALLLLGVVFAIAENHPVPGIGQVILELVHHLSVEGVGHGGEDETHRLGALTLQASGDGVGSVAELLDGLVHLGSGGLAQVTAVVEHSGYGGGGDARQCGNVAEFGLRHGAPLWLRQDMLND